MKLTETTLTGLKILEDQLEIGYFKTGIRHSTLTHLVVAGETICKIRVKDHHSFQKVKSFTEKNVIESIECEQCKHIAERLKELCI